MLATAAETQEAIAGWVGHMGDSRVGQTRQRTMTQGVRLQGRTWCITWNNHASRVVECSQRWGVGSTLRARCAAGPCAGRVPEGHEGAARQVKACTDSWPIGYQTTVLPLVRE